MSGDNPNGNGDYHNDSNGRPLPPDHPHHWRSGEHPADPHATTKHHYQVRFYPGFASRVRLRATKDPLPPPEELAKGATVLYDQQEGWKQGQPKKCFVLPPGATRPLSSHSLELSCSEKGYTVGLHIDDPQHVVEQIIVRLRDPASHAHYDHTRPSENKVSSGGAGTGTAGGGVMAFQDGGSGSGGGGGGGGTTWEIDNTPLVCPPDCP